MDKRIAIQVDNVTKIYRLYNKPSDRFKEALLPGVKRRSKDYYALTNLDMTIYKGETVGIIGTNGSGKSTILKIITGVLSPTKGNCIVDGRISALLELGAGFNMEYNGIENIYLNGTMMGFTRKEIDDRLQSILDFADIGDYVYQPCKTYSSGMFVRLAFAVAINIDPEILIVDEALSVGDVFFQAKCYHKFEEFKKAGKTILFVSHDLSSIAKYCDRVVLLNKGKKLGEGAPKEMIDAYKQVLVGLYQVPEEEQSLLDDEDVQRLAGEAAGGRTGGFGATGASTGLNRRDKDTESNSHLGGVDKLAGVNPDTLEYGNGAATIKNYYITDARGTRTTAVIKGESFKIHFSVEFARDVDAPIFAFTIKNIKGTEITGTNTMYEKAFLEPVKAGDVKNVSFTQAMDLQGGEYLLSLGVTGYEREDFQVYHRLYDVINITVVSDKNTVGYYDMNSVIEVN